MQANPVTVRPSDLAAVATSGDYDDLSNKPTLGTAAAAATGDFATSAQGSTADTALQANQSISLSGDATGSGATSIAATLATVNSNVGSFTNASVTVNAKGLVTAASSGTGGGLTVGTSAVTSGTATRLLYETAGNVVGEITGATSDGAALTLVAPVLGTPASGTLTNATGLPISTGVSGLGTGVGTALAVNVGSAGAPVVLDGALGTPASGTLTNCSGLPASGVTDLAGRNLLINGGPDVWQAGTSFTPTAGTRMRTADTWWALRATSANFTVSRQAGVNSRYCIRAQRTNGTSDTHAIRLAVSLETQDAAWMATALPTLTLSFYARAGADYSAASSNLVINAVRGTGTDQNYLDGYTGSSTLATLTQALTTSFVRYSLTVTPDASTNELAVEFSFTPVGTAGAADYFDIEGLQLEVGAAATNFERRSFAQQLQACLRYYEKSFDYATVPAQNVTAGTQNVYASKAGAVAQILIGNIPLFARKRNSSYSVTLYNGFAANAHAQNRDLGTDCSATAGAALTEVTFLLSVTSPTSTVIGNRFAVNWLAADANF